MVGGEYYNVAVEEERLRSSRISGTAAAINSCRTETVQGGYAWLIGMWRAGEC